MSLSKPTRRKGTTATTSNSLSSKSDGHRQKSAKETSGALSKYWTANEDWERDELADVIYWTRQVLGILCGIIWGLIPLTGGLWLMLFMAVNGLLVFIYYSQVLRIDDEEFGGHWSLLQEGFMPSTGLFLLFWILVYTSFCFP